ncbi:MAG: transposase [Anaerolineaceae bacterium]|nr:transposase [Anaerolineaceae bacterium]
MALPLVSGTSISIIKEQLYSTIDGFGSIRSPVVIVLDNASYHHSYVSEALLAFYENQATVFWLPPYCSDLNPIERFWRHLKDKACANHLFETIAEMIHSVDKVLTIQNDLSHAERFLFTKTFC